MNQVMTETIRPTVSDAPLDPAFQLPRETIGRYRLLNVLGHGSMASVYLAHDPALDRDVAIKTLNHTGSKHANLFETNFINEARAVARLNYPNIVTVYEAGKADGFAYIAMEHLEGHDLRQLIWNETPLTYVQICDMMLRVARALDFAHQHGVVHRDIKPANIFLLNKLRPKILDFGLAQPPISGGYKNDGPSASQPAHHSQIAGTPFYMSPEQINGKPLDGRSDIFSLGVILYELLTGHKAFNGKHTPQVLEQILNHAPTLPSELRRGVPHELERVVARALAKDPTKRYQRAYDLAKDLGRFSAKARAQEVLERAERSKRHGKNTSGSSGIRLPWAKGSSKWGGHWLTDWFGGTTQSTQSLHS